jgi:protein-tyrosine-phosphatase
MIVSLSVHDCTECRSLVSEYPQHDIHIVDILMYRHSDITHIHDPWYQNIINMTFTYITYKYIDIYIFTYT